MFWLKSQKVNVILYIKIYIFKMFVCMCILYNTYYNNHFTYDFNINAKRNIFNCKRSI